jgi:SAM-dependent methyltransferase
VSRHLLEVPNSSAYLVGLDVSTLSLCIGAEAWSRTQSKAPPLWCGGSVLELPFRNACFTNALSFVVFGHVPLRIALRELHRVLVPGGQLIFTTEGLGFWQRLWDAAPRFGAARLGLARWWLGYHLLRLGIHWREISWMRRLAGYMAYSPEILSRTLKEIGFEVEKVEVLRQYEGKPLLLGVVARKSGTDAVAT